MIHNRGETKGAGAAVLALGLLIILPVLYALSMGPVYWLTDGAGWEHKVYVPVWWLARWSKPIKDAVYWWTGFEDGHEG